jgi:hypothetical protein
MPNLLSIERLCLFGVVFTGFCKDGKIPKAKVGGEVKVPAGRGQQGQNILSHRSVDPDNEFKKMLEAGSDPRLARIYAISYKGGYQLLPRPTVFLLHGPGTDPEALGPGGPRFRLDAPGAPPSSTGLPSKLSVFAQDIRVWICVRDDMSVRVGIATGPLGELLL